VERLLAGAVPALPAATTSAVRRTLALAPEWTRVVRDAEPPPALRRLLALGSVISLAASHELIAAVTRDLAAQPRSYLRCADSVAWSSALHAELCAFASVLVPARSDAAQAGALERNLQSIDAALTRSPLRHAWAGSLLASAGMTVGASLLFGERALYAAPLLGLLVPLRGALDHAAYVRGARSALAHAIARDGLSPAALASALRAHPRRRVRSLARLLAHDPGLEWMAVWAGTGTPGL
jgi:hypothetical protein